MRRYTITLGAGTTVGGKVVAASAGASINGVPIALEGDAVDCPACGSRGKILCVGPRIPETWNGRHVALENDLCTCRCSPLPRLLANQTARSQVIKDTGRALSHPLETLPRRQRGAARAARFVLLDEGTGRPLAHREYAVVRQSGRLEFGRSDERGQTHLLSATLHAEAIDIYL